MYRQIKELIYLDQDNEPTLESLAKSLPLNDLLERGLRKGQDDALLEIHRILYVINLAHLSASWGKNPTHIMHPVIVAIKHKIESALENEFNDCMGKEFTLDQLIQFIKDHPANTLHALDTFLKEEASLKQLKEFFTQETPLEMLFGDIIGFLLPGTYGSIKIEILTNYWDELGRGKINHIHRNLRARLMKKLNLSTYSYVNNVELFMLEEMALINLYLSFATNRAKHTELVGALLATELSVVNHFEYQIAGWRRVGFDEHDLAYFDMHISIDGAHSEDWINHVIKPMIEKKPENLQRITKGVVRRLMLRQSLINKLYERLRSPLIASNE